MTAVMFMGIMISLLISEWTGYSPGGVVVVGYLALFFDKPAWLGGTILAALMTYGIMWFFEKRLLLYGRRQFALYMLVGIVVSQIFFRLSMSNGASEIGFLVIGYLVPGLIARDFGRQGIWHTIMIMVLAVALTHLAVMAGDGMIW